MGSPLRTSTPSKTVNLSTSFDDYSGLQFGVSNPILGQPASMQRSHQIRHSPYPAVSTSGSSGAPFIESPRRPAIRHSYSFQGPTTRTVTNIINSNMNVGYAPTYAQVEVILRHQHPDVDPTLIAFAARKGVDCAEQVLARESMPHFSRSIINSSSDGLDVALDGFLPVRTSAFVRGPSPSTSVINSLGYKPPGVAPDNSPHTQSNLSMNDFTNALPTNYNFANHEVSASRSTQINIPELEGNFGFSNNSSETHDAQCHCGCIRRK
jgi:hypothetical protein